MVESYLIGYATSYLFVKSNTIRPSFSQRNNAYSSFFKILLKK